ncbi:hypothetical protein D3C78_1694180 [compost metagenome]
MGAKARIAMMVPPSRGQMVCLITRLIASRISWPLCRPISTPSTTTMALSTSMARAMIIAPSEMRCSSIPSRYMISRLPSTFSDSTAAITRPLRSPMKISRVPTTISRDTTKVSRKPLTELCTS